MPRATRRPSSVRRPPKAMTHAATKFGARVPKRTTALTRPRGIQRAARLDAKISGFGGSRKGMGSHPLSRKGSLR